MARSIVDFETVIYNAKCCAADLAYKGLKEEMFTKPGRFTTYKNVRYIMSLVNILNKHYASVYDIPATYGVTFEVAPYDLENPLDYSSAETECIIYEYNGGYWRLPTLEELIEIYNNQAFIDGLTSNNYWSTDLSGTASSHQVLNPITGIASSALDVSTLYVRPVRSLGPPYDLDSCLTNDEIEDIIQETLELCDQCGCNSKYDIITKDI
jgi:hypothetical protein